MWDDPKALDAAALTLAALAVVALACGALAWVVRQQAFAISEVVVTAPPERASAAHLEAVVREEISGTFFTLDLERTRASLAKVPWVRSVALRRQWPRRLEVTLDEYQPLARWNDSALVDVRGEVFAAAYDGDLPQFTGPEGRAADMAQRYTEWSALLAPVKLALRELQLSARDGWALQAASPAGTLAIQLGREDPAARLARFAEVYGRTLGALSRAGTAVAYVDLRYRNGFAARVPGFREKPAKKAV